MWRADIRALPGSLSRLTSLRTLEIHNTPITYLPPWISNLTQLRLLRVFGTSGLAEVPEEIGLLTKLTLLDLTFTSIIRASIPECVARLPNLEHIYTSLS